MNYYRETCAEINLDHIRDNIQNFQHHLSDRTKVMGVVKANGYGHGSIQVAKTLIENGVDFLAVALLDEALELRHAGIETPILVMGWVAPQYANLAATHGISLTVFQEEWIDAVDPDLEYTLDVHLKIDTGMGRLGIKEENEAKIIVRKIQQNTRLKLEGVFTHFATADELDSKLVNLQRDRFSKFLSLLESEGATPSVIHMGNSAAAIRFPDLDQNYVRVGISLYGLAPSDEIGTILPFPLKPAFSLHSTLSHVKRIKRGDTVSYGATYVAEKEEWIGTIPVGYADGWFRRYAEKGEVLVEGKRAKIVGRICMDQFMVRLPERFKQGAKVTLIGTQGAESITMDDIAHDTGTINYEIPCSISSRVPRCYLKNGKIIEITNEILNFS